MRRNFRLRILGALGIGFFLPSAGAQAQETPVLDTFGFWRMHATLRPPVVAEGSRRVPVKTGMAWLDEARFRRFGLATRARISRLPNRVSGTAVSARLFHGG